MIPGLTRLAMKLLGPCTLIQAAVPEMMKIPDSYHKKNLAIFEENAKMCYEGLRNAPGLKPIMPAGAMYMMVHKPIPFISPPSPFRHLLFNAGVFHITYEARLSLTHSKTLWSSQHQARPSPVLFLEAGGLA